MLKVNGGKQVKDDPRTDRNSDTCPHSSNAPGERSSGGSSSSGGPNKGEERFPTQGGGAPRTECSPPAKLDTSSGGSSGRSSSSGRESGGSSDSKPSNPGGVNKGEERSPTQGGGAPRTECSPPSKRDSSGGGGSFDRGERDRDSDRDSGSSGGGGSGYRPSAQSQPVPKPSAQHGQGNGLSQKPNPAVPALPEEKKGLGEKIRYFWDVATGKSSDGKAKGLYSASGFDGRLSDKQFNFFVKAGGAEYTFEKTLFDGKNFKVDFSGTMGTCQADAWVGMKDGKAGGSAEASLIKYAANVDVSAFGKTLRAEGAFGLGIGVGKSLGMGIFRQASSGGTLFEANIYLRNWEWK